MLLQIDQLQAKTESAYASMQEKTRPMKSKSKSKKSKYSPYSVPSDAMLYSDSYATEYDQSRTTFSHYSPYEVALPAASYQEALDRYSAMCSIGYGHERQHGMYPNGAYANSAYPYGNALAYNSHYMNDSLAYGRHYANEKLYATGDYLSYVPRACDKAGESSSFHPGYSIDSLQHQHYSYFDPLGSSATAHALDSSVRRRETSSITPLAAQTDHESIPVRKSCALESRSVNSLKMTQQAQLSNGCHGSIVTSSPTSAYRHVVKDTQAKSSTRTSPLRKETSSDKTAVEESNDTRHFTDLSKNTVSAAAFWKNGLSNVLAVAGSCSSQKELAYFSEENSAILDHRSRTNSSYVSAPPLRSYQQVGYAL